MKKTYQQKRKLKEDICIWINKGDTSEIYQKKTLNKFYSIVKFKKRRTKTTSLFLYKNLLKTQVPQEIDLSKYDNIHSVVIAPADKGNTSLNTYLYNLNK